jgi:protein phosphatase
MVNDEDIKQIVASTGDIREACRRLIQRANERGGEDNITAVLIKIEDVHEDRADPDGPTADEAEGGAKQQESGTRHPAANGKTGTSGP